MKMEQEKVPQMPRRMPLSEAQTIGVYVRPVKQKHVNFWNLERIGIVHVRQLTRSQKVMKALFRRYKGRNSLFNAWKRAEPIATLNWVHLEQFNYMLNEQQAISYAQNMIAQRPNTHERVEGKVIFGSNRVPAVKKDGE